MNKDANQNSHSEPDTRSPAGQSSGTAPVFRGSVTVHHDQGEKSYVRVHKPKQAKRERRSFGLILVAVALMAAMIGGGVGAGIASFYLLPKGSSQTANQPVQVVHQNDKTGNYLISDIAKMVVPTVVGITNYGQTAGIFGQSGIAKQASGSGVIIRSDGTIVTNFHVIAGASKMDVTLADGKTYPAAVVGYDKSADLAVLKIEIKGKEFPAIKVGDSDKLQVGDLAVAVGNPLGETFSQTVTDGIISGINRKLEMDNNEYTLIQTNCAINSGNSGGALVNGKGELVGINSVKIQAQGVEGLGFAIPINSVMKIADRIEKNGTQEKPFIGISGYSLNDDLAQQLHINQTSGLLVMQIVEGGPADQAGILPGDIIIAADGKDVKNFDDMQTVLKNKKVGEKINVVIIREQEKRNAQLILGENTNTAVPR